MAHGCATRKNEIITLSHFKRKSIQCTLQLSWEVLQPQSNFVSPFLLYRRLLLSYCAIAPMAVAVATRIRSLPSIRYFRSLPFLFYGAWPHRYCFAEKTLLRPRRPQCGNLYNFSTFWVSKLDEYWTKNLKVWLDGVKVKCNQIFRLVVD